MVIKHTHAQDDPRPTVNSKITLPSKKSLLSAQEIEEIADIEIACTRNHGRPLSLLSIVIDQLKSAGVANVAGAPPIASEVAQTCAGLLRSNDFIGSVSDTTIVVLLTATLAKGALHAAERLRTAISNMNNSAPNDNARRITISIGIVSTRTGRTTYGAMRSRADAKRDDARTDGGNRIIP